MLHLAKQHETAHYSYSNPYVKTNTKLDMEYMYFFIFFYFFVYLKKIFNCLLINLDMYFFIFFYSFCIS